MKFLNKLLATTSLITILNGCNICPLNYHCSDLGIMVYKNDYGNKLNLDEVDSHFLDIENKLGYENTSTDLCLKVHEAEMCETTNNDKEWCFVDEWGQKNVAYFDSRVKPWHIEFQNGNGTIPLEKTGYRFELNRYFKLYYEEKDWDCDDMTLWSKGQENTCFKDFYIDYNPEDNKIED